MGMWARLFSNSTDARMERAERFIDQGRYNDARLELEGIENANASTMRETARTALAKLNIDEAHARMSSGDPDGAQEHLKLAKEFGADRKDIQAVRRFGRTLRDAERKKTQDAEEAALQPVGDDPIWSLPPDHPRLRYALLVEGYPEALRERLAQLGEDFARSVMTLEDGDPSGAFTALSRHVGTDPVARYERARAALALGKLPAAASDLMTFGETVGHQRIGNIHTAVMLTSVLAQLKRTDEALTMIEANIKQQPDLELMAQRAGLLELSGRLEDAEKATTAVLRKAPRQMGLYRQLARIRIRLGARLGAMQALEGGLSTCCSAPGKCGSQPLDVDAVRTLAQLYLEDRIEPKRTQQLLSDLANHVEKPTWEDHYISALIARNEENPETPRLAQQLLAPLPSTDPRQDRVRKAFGAF